MNLFSFLYTELLYRPLVNGLVFFYTVFPWQDMGVAIVALTIVIRLILLPILWKAQKAQRALAGLQPEIKKIQERFKNSKEEQSKQLMKLYAERNVNPFSGCLPLVVQLIIFIALFRVFQHTFDPSQLSYVYSFLERPEALNPISFGTLDLSQRNIPLAVLSSLTLFFQTRLTSFFQETPSKKGDFAHMFQLQSMYLFPILMFLWVINAPSAFGLYLTVLNVFGIMQEIIAKRAFTGRDERLTQLFSRLFSSHGTHSAGNP